VSDKFLFKAGDMWTTEILEAAWEEIEKIGKEELRLTWYKPQIEVISARQMLDAYSSNGLPIYYKHWSFGKDFISSEKQYKNGQMGLAYEIVINSDPCIAYLMEENSALMQVFVIAHASVGHSAVFKNNYLFIDNTDAGAIVEYLNFAKNYLKMCEEKYGADEVEAVLDACHSLSSYGINRYRKPKKLKPADEEARAMGRFDQKLKDYDPVWEKVGKKPKTIKDQKDPIEDGKLKEPQENILYFIEKNAPALPGWKREVIRITRKVAEYFSPQGPTKVLNEGFASFTHYYIMNRLYDKGFIDAGSMFEMLATHTNVLYQRSNSSFNPYRLGFEIFMDIKRMCEEPTDEDRIYFPRLCGTDWVGAVKFAMENFKDETFILQYLSPKVVRDLKLYVLHDAQMTDAHYTVTNVSSDRDFYAVREKLARMYSNENRTPDIQITHCDKTKSRTLVLRHFPVNDRPLEINAAKDVVGYISDLWEYPVRLFTHTVNIAESKFKDAYEYLEDVVIINYGKYGEPPDDMLSDEEMDMIQLNLSL
jgi:stage V sporulation protein R